MRHDVELANAVRQEMNEALSFLDERPSLHYDIMHHIKGERIVKKKLSVGFVLVIVLLLAATAALAASLLWRDYVPQMKQTEQELGDYAEWPAAQRMELAGDLVEMGYIEADELTAVLTSDTTAEQEKAAAADQLILKLTGLNDVKEVHSTLITYAIMGHEDTWSPEQRVWWNGIVNMHSTADAPDTLIVPTNEDLSEEDAIAIAKAAIMEAYSFDEAYMAATHPVANLYVTDEHPDYRRWDVQFKKYREGSDSYVEKVYCAIVDEDGKVIADPEVGVSLPTDSAARSKAANEKPDYVLKYIEYQETLGRNLPFWDWNYEVKAAYYAEVAPMVENLESLYTEVAYSTLYAYGLPTENDIQYEAAIALARQVLRDEYDLTDEQVAAYSHLLEAFDVTVPGQSMWKFVFINPDDWYGIRYRVLLESTTGEIILHESYPWQINGQDEAYDRKLY